MLELEALRDHIGDGPSDDVLERLLTAAFQTIEERIGPAEGPVSELLRPSGSLIHLSRRALNVIEVREGGTLVDESGYRLRSGGHLLMRLRDGVPARWTSWVDVTYQAFPDDAERERVAIALVGLDLNYMPGVTTATIGSFTEQYAQGDRTYQVERESILATLRKPTRGLW